MTPTPAAARRLLAAVYPTRTERLLRSVATVAWRLRLQRLGNLADNISVASLRRRADNPYRRLLP